MKMIGEKRSQDSMDAKWSMTPLCKRPRGSPSVEEMLRRTPSPLPLPASKAQPSDNACSQTCSGFPGTPWYLAFALDVFIVVPVILLILLCALAGQEVTRRRQDEA